MSLRSEVFALLFAYPAAMNATDLKPVTLKAWNDYVLTAEARLQNEAERKVLWMDSEPDRRNRVRSGEIAVSPAGGKTPRSVPYGLIHDWIAVAFIPNVSLKEVLAVVQNYDLYATYYGPTIRTSKTLFRKDGNESFQVRYARKALFQTVVLDAQYDVRYYRVDDQHWYSIARSTSIQQIQNADEPGERALPRDDGSGFLWRAYSMSQFEASDGGVYVEQESIALSTDIPAMWRWIVRPFVDRLARTLAASSLGQTRSAVISAARGAGEGSSRW